MASQRELPKAMFSDNGINFIGAEREMHELVKQLDQEKINKSTANKRIKWQFNPPAAPHFGGIHESMIKPAKIDQAWVRRKRRHKGRRTYDRFHWSGGPNQLETINVPSSKSGGRYTSHIKSLSVRTTVADPGGHSLSPPPTLLNSFFTKMKFGSQ